MEPYFPTQFGGRVGKSYGNIPSFRHQILHILLGDSVDLSGMGLGMGIGHIKLAQSLTSVHVNGELIFKSRETRSLTMCSFFLDLLSAKCFERGAWFD